MGPQPLTPETNGFNVFALKACQCLRALGSVMVMIVLLLILLTYYTTVFLVYGKMMFMGGNKAIAATVIVIIYNLLVSARLGCRTGSLLVVGSKTSPESGGGRSGLLRTRAFAPLALTALCARLLRRSSCFCGATSLQCSRSRAVFHKGGSRARRTRR